MSTECFIFCILPIPYLAIHEPTDYVRQVNLMDILSNVTSIYEDYPIANITSSHNRFMEQTPTENAVCPGKSARRLLNNRISW